MTWIILEMIFSILLIVLPATLYYSNRPAMAKFYLRMVASSNARKLYVYCFLMVLLLYHFVYAGGHPDEWGVLFSTVLCAVLFSFKRAENLMRKMYYDKRKLFTMSIVVLAICAVPHLHTSAMTLAYFILAKMFYPSCSMMKEWEENKESRKYWTEHPDVLPSYYFH